MEIVSQWNNYCKSIYVEIVNVHFNFKISQSQFKLDRFQANRYL